MDLKIRDDIAKMKEKFYGFQSTQHCLRHLARMDIGKVMYLMMSMVTIQATILDDHV